MLKYFLTPLLFIFILSSCASRNQIKKPASVDDILSNKENMEYYNIKVTSLDNAISVVLEDDKLKFIAGLNLLPTYSISEDEYVIYISKSGYDTKLDRYIEKDCGRGNALGYIGILAPEQVIDSYKGKNETFCSHKFTSTSDYMIADRIASGIITFGTSIITAANIHKKHFDEELFKESIIESKLYMARDKIIDKFYSLEIKNGLDVIYVDVNDLEDSFDDAFEELALKTHKRDGIVIMDEESKKLLSLVVFNQNIPITQSITQALAQINSDISSLNLKDLKAEDLQKHIPSPIKTPKLPPLKELVKDEFETKKEFLQRVETEVQKREEKIQKIQREYELEVHRRNNYIYSLENSFLEYNRYIDKRKTQLFNSLVTKSDNLAKLLFLERLSGYNAVNFRYDAETQRLYFNIFANNADINNLSFITIEPKYAKKIKLQREFNIVPVIETSKGGLTLKDVLLIHDDQEYKVKFTNINYKPEFVHTTVKKVDEKIITSYNSSFKEYIQEPLELLDYKKKEIWYIDVAERFNAKVPKWFQETISSKEFVVGYGTADTLSSAITQARSEIAFMISSRVNSEVLNQENVNNFNSNFSFKTTTHISTDIELDNKKVEVIKQELVDGKWYVAMSYKSVKQL